MKQDFDMLIYKFNNNIKIKPLSDLHIGSQGFMSKEWLQFKEEILQDENTYIVIAGDMMDNALKSSVSNVYEQTMRPADQKKWLSNELKDIKDRILCIVSGNHERRSEKDSDDNPLYDVCCKLDIEDRYRSNMAFIKIQLGERNSKRQTYVLGITHGSGGGSTGNAINRNEKFAYAIDGLDLLITGHTHKPANSFPAKILVDSKNNKVSIKPFKTIIASSWQAYAGYPLREMMNPSAFVKQTITLHLNEKIIETNVI